jgi:hypothetical protein
MVILYPRREVLRAGNSDKSERLGQIGGRRLDKRRRLDAQ